MIGQRDAAALLAIVIGAAIVTGCSGAVSSSDGPKSSRVVAGETPGASAAISGTPTATTPVPNTPGPTTIGSGKRRGSTATAGAAKPGAATPGAATPGATPGAETPGATEGTPSQGGDETQQRVDVLLKPAGSVDVDAVDAELKAMQQRLDRLEMPTDSDFDDAAGALY